MKVHVAWMKAADATAGALLCRVLGRLCPAPPAPASPPPAPRSILVIRPGGLGDMLLLLPALRALRERHPAAAIAVLCERRNLAALALRRVDAAALAYDVHPLRCLRALRAGRFDTVVDTEQFHHLSAVLAALTGAPVRIGFKINPVRNSLYTHLAAYDLEANETAQFMALLRPLGVQPAAPACALADADVPESPALRAALDGLPAGGPLVVIGPGSSTRQKRWPAERFAGLAGRLIAERGARVALAGGRDDAPEAAAVARRLAPAAAARAVVTAGRLDLAGSAGLLRRADLLVATDSGLAQIGAALDTPTVALFGPSDERKWAPPRARLRIIRRRLPCAPCSVFGYYKPCRAAACMNAIDADEVFEACVRMLDKSERPDDDALRQGLLPGG